MILPRNFVEDFRTQDRVANMIFAWIEHDWVPDEHFFTLISLRKDSPYYSKVIRDHKRFIGAFVNNLHPQWLDDSHIETLKQGAEEDKYFWARKIKISEEEGLVKWMDSVRNDGL
jgi:hypothetical protein